MKKSSLLWALVAPILFMLPSCEQAENHDHDAAINLDAVKTEIQGMENAFAVAEIAKNVDGVAAYYAADAESLADHEPTRVGMEAIKAGIRKDFESDTTNTNLTVVFTATGVWAAGNYATETGTSAWSDKDGKVVRTGKYMTLFELRDGKYIAIRDIWNNDVPPATTPAAE